ncbi:2-C-methyl-D-erythritol 4-phosphate cytidylyltransferase [Ornithinimicrobium sp. Y1847]
MPKALVPLGHGPAAEPIVVHALRSVLACGAITDVVVVAPADPSGMAQLASALDAQLLIPDRGHDLSPPGTRSVATGDTSEGAARVTVVAGGAERSDSVSRGLAALPAEVGVVLVHDAARALTPVEVFDSVVGAVRQGHAAVTPALPVIDTIKQVEAGPDGETVVATLDRSTLRAVQTPQGFLRETLERAHLGMEDAVTDDCGMVEAMGGRVHVIPGSARALKITTQHDLEVAAGWLADIDPDPSAQPHRRPVLAVLSGLPGVGKTTLARELCRLLPAAHLRVDTIEQGLMRGGLPESALGAEGYGAAYAVAADQLAVGLSVVADLVNGTDVVRTAWDEVGATAGARVVRVLVECSDPVLHRRRVEQRVADIPGHLLPDWEQVRSRQLDPWPTAELRVDTAAESPHTAALRIAAHLQEPPT